MKIYTIIIAASVVVLTTSCSSMKEVTVGGSPGTEIVNPSTMLSYGTIGNGGELRFKIKAEDYTPFLLSKVSYSDRYTPFALDYRERNNSWAPWASLCGIFGGSALVSATGVSVALAATTSDFDPVVFIPFYLVGGVLTGICCYASDPTYQDGYKYIKCFRTNDDLLLTNSKSPAEPVSSSGRNTKLQDLLSK